MRPFNPFRSNPFGPFKSLKIPFIVSLILLFALACEPVDGVLTVDPTENDETPTLEKVTFIAGTDDNQAVYWKNGQKVVLPVGNNATSSVAHSIYVNEDGVIFVAGNIVHENVGEIPVYWVNNTLHELIEEDEADGLNIAEAIIEKDGKVMVAGTKNAKPVYWVNGIKQDLKIAGNIPTGMAHSITIDDDDNLFISGSGYTGTSHYGYWKNGDFVDLPTLEVADVLSVFTSDNSVYASGYTYNPGDYTENNTDNVRLVVWKDGVMQELGERGMAFSVYAYEDQTYVTGYTEDPITATAGLYYIDSVEYNLPKSTNGRSIFVNEDGIYIAGSIYDGNYHQAAYWINDQPHLLTEVGGSAMSIFIAEISE